MIFDDIRSKSKKYKTGTMIVFTVISFLSGLFAGAFSSSSIVSSMEIAVNKTIKESDQDFVYAEAISNQKGKVFLDYSSQQCMEFDNFWHFSGRPDIFAFYKFDSITYGNDNETYFPLRFNYGTDEFENPCTYTPSIITTIGSRWIDDPSHIHLDLKYSVENLEMLDSFERQETIFLSEELANKMAGENGNIEDLVGKTIYDGVAFTNSNFHESSYNNADAQGYITKCFIGGILDSSCYSKYSTIFGEEFVYMYSDYALYLHIGAKIGCCFSSDRTANRLALTYFLSLGDNDSSIHFYNSFSNEYIYEGKLQQIYESNLKFLNKSISKVLTVIFYLVFIGSFVYLFRLSTIMSEESNRQSILNLVLYLGVNMFLTIICSIVRAVRISNIFVNLVSTAGTILLLITSLIFIAFTFVSTKDKLNEHKKYSFKINLFEKTKLSSKNVIKPYIKSLLFDSLIGILPSVLFYIFIFAFKDTNKGLFYPYAVSNFGVVVVLLFECFRILKLENELNKKIIIQKIVSISLSGFISFILIFLICLLNSNLSLIWIPKFIFSWKFAILSILNGIIVSIITFIITVFILRKKSSSSNSNGSTSKDKYTYFEI